MPSTTKQKTKQRLSLARRIESLGNKRGPCSRCRRQERTCFATKSASLRCSECVRSKSPCDLFWPTPFPVITSDRGRPVVVCCHRCSEGHFFLQYPGDAEPPCPSASLTSEEVPEISSPPVDWSVLDASLAAALADYDPSDPFWATLDFDGGMTQADPSTS